MFSGFLAATNFFEMPFLVAVMAGKILELTSHGRM